MWSVLIVNWLTIGSTEVDGEPLVMLVQPESGSSACRIPPLEPPLHAHEVAKTRHSSSTEEVPDTDRGGPIQ